MTSWTWSKPGERLQRGDPVLLGLADADQDPARERDLQLAGGADRRQALVRVLGRRALVGDQVGVDRLEHQALGGGDLAQAGEVVPASAPRLVCGSRPRSSARSQHHTT